MEKQAIVDESGKWVTNKGAFPFTDPGTGVKYEPRQPTKVKVTEWVMHQPVLEYEGKDKDLEAFYKAKEPKVEVKK